MKIFNEKTAKQTAYELLKIKAVKLSPSDLFTWTSGIRSPIYCDNRKILSFPETRNYIKKQFADLIKINYPDADVIAGVATGAIEIGALTADILGKPFVYVRSNTKKHGLSNRIEGVLRKDDKVVVIEDLVSTGMSSIEAVNAIKQKGNKVLGMCAVFTYKLPIAVKNFKNIDCELVTLSDFDILSEFAFEYKYITKEELEILRKWKFSNFTKN